MAGCPAGRMAGPIARFHSRSVATISYAREQVRHRERSNLSAIARRATAEATQSQKESLDRIVASLLAMTGGTARVTQRHERVLREISGAVPTRAARGISGGHAAPSSFGASLPTLRNSRPLRRTGFPAFAGNDDGCDSAKLNHIPSLHCSSSFGGIRGANSGVNETPSPACTPALNSPVVGSPPDVSMMVRGRM
jgi:hypothetical protein